MLPARCACRSWVSPDPALTWTDERAALPFRRRAALVHSGAERLDELGAQMTKRRLELAVPRGGEIAGNMIRAMPASSMALAAGAAVSGAFLASWLGRKTRQRD